jgi:hypothetical protein
MQRLSLLVAGVCLLTISCAIQAQTTTGGPSINPKNAVATRETPDKTAKDPEAERILRERRANAQSLLISLAADAANFSDQKLRARTEARIADVLWDADQERARTMFRKAWDAAESADNDSRRQMLDEVARQKARSGNVAIAGSPSIRNEVLRLAAKRDHALGEEFLAKLKIEKQQELSELADSNRPDPFNSGLEMSQRLSLARQLLDTDVARALQFADPALGTVTREGLNFLSYLRDKDAVAADRRYAALLGMSANSLSSDANTVSILSSYLFTPHMFITFSGPGGASNSTMAPETAPPQVAPELRAAFFSAGAQILMRPQPPPGQDQTSSGPEGKYLVIKRLLPLFEQFAPKEIGDTLRTQMEALSSGMPSDLRQRDDELLREGIRAQKSDEDRQQALLDRIDHAKTSEERDRLYLQLAQFTAGNLDMKARDYVAKIEDQELRQKAAPYIDATMTMRAVDKKDSEKLLELVRIGELTHFQKAWALTKAAGFLAKTDHDKSLALIDDATAEARRIETSDPDRPRAMLAIATVLLLVDRAKVWDLAYDIAKAANSAEGFSGEDGVMRISLLTKGSSSIHSTSSGEFDVGGVFNELAKDDYNKTVELARLFEREAPRASAVIAIARSVLGEKKKA